MIVQWCIAGNEEQDILSKEAAKKPYGRGITTVGSDLTRTLPTESARTTKSEKADSPLGKNR